MNAAVRLLNAVNKSRKRIVVAGDAMTDCWVYGSAGECNDSCMRFSASRIVTSPGGAANAHQCLQHWSVNADLFTYPSILWPKKYRMVGPDGNITYRLDDEVAVAGASPDHPLCGFAWRYSVDRMLEMVGCADGVLLSDYDKGYLTPELIRNISETCIQRGVPCVADCKRAPEVYEGCYLKCNADYQHRYNDALSNLVYDADAGPSLVVTDGPLNPCVWSGGDLIKGYPFMPAVQMVNHVGAGDCFGAHLVMALAYDFSLKEAAAVAHSAGRVYVQHAHNRAPHPLEIARDMDGINGG